MDGQRFDEIVKRLCTTRLTRLSALRGLAGGAVAALAGGLLAPDELEAKAKRSRKRTKRQGHTTLRQQQLTAEADSCRAEGRPCEGSNPNCCPGLVCSLSTHPTTCVACGAQGEECCADFQCTAPLVCGNGQCVPPGPGTCGQATQPCCQPGNVCIGANVCVSGTCQPCGDPGEPCCANNICPTNHICQGSTCVACGQAANQPCCSGSCVPGLSCENGLCAPCGAIGLPCCNGACNAGATCSNGTCVAGPTPPPQPCSAANPCPPGTVCSSSGVCVSTAGLRCRTNETPLRCCFRAVARGCRRKQQSNQARKNCLKRGKRRCKNRFAGL